MSTMTDEHGCPHCGRGVAPITGGPMRGRWPRHKDDLPWLTVGWCPGSGQPVANPATSARAGLAVRRAVGATLDDLTG